MQSYADLNYVAESKASKDGGERVAYASGKLVRYSCASSRFEAGERVVGLARTGGWRGCHESILHPEGYGRDVADAQVQCNSENSICRIDT